jgi:hypothetical protein
MIPQYWPPDAVLQVSGVQPAVGPALHRRSWQVHPSLAQVWRERKAKVEDGQ